MYDKPLIRINKMTMFFQSIYEAKQDCMCDDIFLMFNRKILAYNITSDFISILGLEINTSVNSELNDIHLLKIQSPDFCHSWWGFSPCRNVKEGRLYKETGGD